MAGARQSLEIAKLFERDISHNSGLSTQSANAT
jgi:hypothetical protein